MDDEIMDIEIFLLLDLKLNSIDLNWFDAIIEEKIDFENTIWESTQKF